MTNLQYKPKTAGKLVHTSPFFGNIAWIVVLFIFFVSFGFSLQGQVRVTGHVFAEIVEPTALSAKANNSHHIQTTGITSNNDMVLAEVKISGGMNMNIDVAVRTSDLVAANGQILPFDAFACPGCAGDSSQNPTGEQLFTLKGTPGESIRQSTNTTFSGRYSVVFMYN